MRSKSLNKKISFISEKVIYTCNFHSGILSNRNPGVFIRVGSHQHHGILEEVPEVTEISLATEAVEVKDNRELLAGRASLWSPYEGGSVVATGLLTPGLMNG